MSWFTDIAGKAEHFLNKVDQGAASALQAEQLQKTYNSKPVTSAYIEPRINEDKSSTFKSASVDQPKLEKNSSVPKNQSFKTKVKLNNREDDEKLLEYLNNSNVNTNDMEAKKKVKHSRTENDANSAKIDSMNANKVNNNRVQKSEQVINSEEKPQHAEKPSE